MSSRDNKNLALEREFREAQNLVRGRIEKELALANEALNRAALFADTVGVPFDIYLEALNRNLQYVPETFKKFSELDFIVTGVGENVNEDWDLSWVDDEDDAAWQCSEWERHLDDWR